MRIFPTAREQVSPEIADVQEQVQNSGEVRDAIDQLVFHLEYAYTKEAEDLAWNCFQDRMKLAVIRAKQYAQDILEGA
jgi:hypothetical protein